MMITRLPEANRWLWIYNQEGVECSREGGETVDSKHCATWVLSPGPGATHIPAVTKEICSNCRMDAPLANSLVPFHSSSSKEPS
jgi:hypothetical protein